MNDIIYVFILVIYFSQTCLAGCDDNLCLDVTIPKVARIYHISTDVISIFNRDHIDTARGMVLSGHGNDILLIDRLPTLSSQPDNPSNVIKMCVFNNNVHSGDLKITVNLSKGLFFRHQIESSQKIPVSIFFVGNSNECKDANAMHAVVSSYSPKLPSSGSSLYSVVDAQRASSVSFRICHTDLNYTFSSEHQQPCSTPLYLFIAVRAKDLVAISSGNYSLELSLSTDDQEEF